MAILTMYRTGMGLMPADQASIEAVNRIPTGAHLTVKLSVPRNIRQHRLLFAMLNTVFEAQREPRAFPTVEKLLDAIKMATGHTREVRDLRGNTHMVPDSIAFGRLDQIAFQQWFDAAIKVVLENILPRVEKKELIEQIYTMLREPTPDDMRQ
jgi:hypothetical protein